MQKYALLLYIQVDLGSIKAYMNESNLHFDGEYFLFQGSINFYQFSENSFLQNSFAEINQQIMPLSIEKNILSPIIETNLTSHDKNQSRKRRNIEVHQAKKQQLQLAFKGKPSESMELHHNFKTLIKNAIKDFSYLKLFNKDEVQRYQAFLKSSPSFQNLLKLIYPTSNQIKVLKQKICEYVQSKEIIVDILQSKIRMSQKLMMLKYIEIIRLNVISNGKKISWKGKKKIA